MPKKPPAAPVPQTRFGRFMRIGLAAGELAMGAAAEGMKRLSRGESGDFGASLLTGANATRLASRLAHMRGAAMKLGQILSLQGEEFLPPEFSKALPGRKVARLYQIENKMDAVMRYDLAGQIPVVEE